MSELNIIVGGGIAGAALSRKMEKKGLDYVCFEKKSRAECEHKLCANGLTQSCYDTLKEIYNVEPESIIVESITKMKISMFGKEYSANFGKPYIYMCDRKKLYSSIAPNGIEYGKKVINVECGLHGRGKAALSNGEILVGKLFGADGATSVVRRAMTLPGDYGVCYQKDDTYDEESDTIKLIVDYGRYTTGPAFIGAEYWFPYEGGAKHGVGFRYYHHTGSNYKDYGFPPGCLGNLQGTDILTGIELLNDTKQPEGMEGYPIGYDMIGLPNLVGDAKGAAYILTGEGIYPALITAAGALEPKLEAYRKFIEKKKRFDRIGRAFWFEHKYQDGFWLRSILSLGARHADFLYGLYLNHQK